MCWFLCGGWVRPVTAGKDWRQSWSSSCNSRRNEAMAELHGVNNKYKR
jgi:hypothetical protein